ncbi:MAG: tyrosine--tRNA ligase [Acholeplasmataceae bacterium]|nr:tyrosine--tRNA ligase [Acholeplasmataceae bacterium]
MKLYDELKWRGMIKDSNSPELAEKRLNNESLKFYIGYDPTGDSLTIGHLVQIVRTKLLESKGHIPIVLIGGATGLIGDPREVGERKLLTLEDSLANANKIKNQISKFFNPKTIFVNNYDWISKIDMISFLRDYGKEFNINYMLAKDVVQRRLDTGISYTEFSYMLIQAIDFLNLYENYDCQMQFGGSDQWGNITAGLELIRKRHPNNQAIGMSSPLLLKSDGSKFGKSEGGAIWLDEQLTSPYELYQYLINTPDEDVILYLKTLSLLKPEEIIELEKSVKNNPEERLAQRTLATEVVEFVHGKDNLKSAIKVTEALFSGEVENLNEKEFKMLAQTLPNYQPTVESLLIDALVETKLASSKREAREFINNGAITLNNEKITDINYVLNINQTYHNKYAILKRGKKKFSIIEF